MKINWTEVKEKFDRKFQKPSSYETSKKTTARINEDSLIIYLKQPNKSVKSLIKI